MSTCVCCNKYYSHTNLVCATEGQEISDLFWSGLGKVGQFPHELDGLSGGHQPDIVHLHQGVDERLKTRPVVRLREPSRVVEQAEGGAVGHVVPLEVLHQQLVNIVSCQEIDMVTNVIFSVCFFTTYSVSVSL